MKSQTVSKRRTRPGRRELLIVGICALLGAALAALAVNWQLLFPVPAEKLVEVVWTHECACVHAWMAALRAQGYVVRDFEMESLRATRRRWQIPGSARGCHPARYMGYYLDGHMSGTTLRRLAKEHPAGLGLEERRVGEAHGEPKGAENATVLTTKDGTAIPWP